MKLQMGSPGISQEELESHYLGKGIRVITVDVSQDRTAKTISYGFTLVGKVEQSFHEVYRELASREDVQSIQLISVD
jgi:hypothetical protein